MRTLSTMVKRWPRPWAAPSTARDRRADGNAGDADAAVRADGGRCRFGQETFAGVRGNGRDAPIPAVREGVMEPRGPALNSHSQRCDIGRPDRYGLSSGGV